MSNLFQRSIEIILNNQNSTGAYPACPNFSNYRYCWFRDGAFIAYAMDLVDEHTSAARFHDWAASNINRRADIIERAVMRAARGEPLHVDDILHTRYSMDSEAANEDWPNFQLDGFGTWLWALGEHKNMSKIPLKEEWLSAAQLVADYLAALWDYPSYDCWEEFPDQIHPYTLAAIYAGLKTHTVLDGTDHRQTCEGIRNFIRERAVMNGHFVKLVGSDDVDASLLGLAVPYRLISPDNPLMKSTVTKIEATLRNGGGVHRYARDTYYGGGEWILLTTWLGWYYAQVGKQREAEALLSWIEAQADAQGQLAEQIPATLNDKSYYEPWRERWGEIAKPLLWSHAKYIILSLHLLSPQTQRTE